MECQIVQTSSTALLGTDFDLVCSVYSSLSVQTFNAFMPSPIKGILASSAFRTVLPVDHRIFFD